MKNQITLTNETVETLRKLYTQIDVEMKKPAIEVDIDLVTENQMTIYDTIKKLIF